MPRWLAALIALALTSLCAAQQGGKVLVRSALFPGAGVLDPIQLYTGEGGESVEVPLWGGKFTPEFELPRMDVWRFGRWTTEANEQGRQVPVFHERGRVVPPAAGRVWLILFQAKPDEDSPLVVQAFGVDEAGFEEGAVAVLNLSKVPVGVQIADRKARVEPGAREIIAPGSERGQSYGVKFFYPHHGQLRPFVATNWYHGERLRRLALVLQAGEAQAPKLLVVDDIAAREGVGGE